MIRVQRSVLRSPCPVFSHGATGLCTPPACCRICEFPSHGVLRCKSLPRRNCRPARCTFRGPWARWLQTRPVAIRKFRSSPNPLLYFYFLGCIPYMQSLKKLYLIFDPIWPCVQTISVHEALRKHTLLREIQWIAIQMQNLNVKKCSIYAFMLLNTIFSGATLYTWPPWKCATPSPCILSLYVSPSYLRMKKQWIILHSSS